MKKILLLIIPTIILLIFTLSRTDTSTLYLLNWGEYIDPSLIEEFEEEYNITVVMDEVGSSEDMYQKVKSGTTSYDVCIPGDYMIEKMYLENMIQKLDYSKVPNYHSGMFNDDLTRIRKSSFFEGNEDYCVPYFWGAYAIIYSTRNESVGQTIEANGFNAIFDPSLYATSVKLAMYDVPRFATTAYLLTQGKNINTTSKPDYEGVVEALTKANYTLWGNDNIKKQIAEGNIDAGLVQLGDFFDQYYLSLSSGEQIKFSCYIPDNTVAFFDAMVIPTTSKNPDLGYKFINFMLDTNHSFQNASYVGYTPTIKEVVNKIKSSKDFEEILDKYPFYVDPLKGNDAPLFRYIDCLDDGTNYQEYLITLINKAKSQK